MFFIVESSSSSEDEHNDSYQKPPSLNAYKAQLDMSSEKEDAEDEHPLRKRSVKHRQKSATRIQSRNDGEIIIEIGKCIENLRAGKDVLKAENAQLTRDIRNLNALKLQQAGLQADMEQIIEEIHKRHARFEGPHCHAAKKARTVRKMAARIKEDKWAELKMIEGMLEPYVEIDEDGDVVLMQNYEDDAEKETLFDDYTKTKSSYTSLRAATTRLLQSRMELLNLGDFVKKVERMAIGDVHTPRDRLFQFLAMGMIPAKNMDRGKTPSAGVRRRA